MGSAQRIVSFLPSATEMVCALGLDDKLLAVTHECDFPAAVKQKPVVVRSAIPVETMTEAEIDSAVSTRIASGQSVYQVDEVLFQELAPDLILTQDLCQVCAPSGNEITQALKVLPSRPEILWLTPKSLRGIAENLREIGRATGSTSSAEQWIAIHFGKLEKIEQKSRAAGNRPRVFCMEWLDPLYCSGHWVPEMVRIAGGTDELSREGTDSVRVKWDDVLQWAPEILIIMPCGCHLDAVLELTPKLAFLPGWRTLPAVREQRVYAVDASSYFARPGPRIIAGTELLAHLIHPELFEWSGPSDAFRRLEL